MMKYLQNLFLVFLLLLVASSCSDDDDSMVNANPIVGNWEILEINFNLQEDGVVTFDQAFSTDVCNAPLIFAFESDNDFNITNASLELDFGFDGNPSLICSMGNGTLPGSWEQTSGNNYMITSEGEPSEAQILLSNNSNTIEVIVINEYFDQVDDTLRTDTLTFRGTRN